MNANSRRCCRPELLPADGMDLLVAGVDPDDVINEIASVLRRARVAVRGRGRVRTPDRGRAAHPAPHPVHARSVGRTLCGGQLWRRRSGAVGAGAAAAAYDLDRPPGRRSGLAARPAPGASSATWPSTSARCRSARGRPRSNSIRRWSAWCRNAGRSRSSNTMSIRSAICTKPLRQGNFTRHQDFRQISFQGFVDHAATSPRLLTSS